MSGPSSKLKRTYRAFVGTGGVGTGQFFALSGNETLGREESRMGRFLDRRDYCKLHIIAHCVRKLTDPRRLKVYPIAAVGEDAEGGALVAEMEAAGLDVSHVEERGEAPTLSCVCLLYPDGSGGNLTVEDSASDTVSRKQIDKAADLLGPDAIVAALPEVPLSARCHLMERAQAVGAFVCASFTSQELRRSKAEDLRLPLVDFLALNSDEAAAMAGLPADACGDEAAEAAWQFFSALSPDGILSVTLGKLGSWIFCGEERHFLAPPPIQALSGAGAGDAHFSGFVSGICEGLEMESAHQLAVLSGALAVESAHTIHPDFSKLSVWDLANKTGFPITEELITYLKSS